VLISILVNRKVPIIPGTGTMVPDSQTD